MSDGAIGSSRRPFPTGAALRIGVAAAVVGGGALLSAAVIVPAGEARVVTEFGAPVRVLATPGLAWKLPAPVETTIPVSLRLRTTSGGLEDVGTRDGLRILVQAFVAWRVGRDPDSVERFVRAGGNDTDGAAAEIRSFLGSALQVTASDFALTDLVNTDPARVRIDAFEAALRSRLETRLRDIYGIELREVGVERVSLPAETLDATVARMRSERETVASERTASGMREAAAIRSDADRDSRIEAANAATEAASIEARGETEAAAIDAEAYARDPALYATLRSLDTLGAVIGRNTHLVLRTDSVPFRSLTDAPPSAGAAPARAAPTPAAGRAP